MEEVSRKLNRTSPLFRVNRMHEIRYAVVRNLFGGETDGSDCIFEITRILFNFYPERGKSVLSNNEYEKCVDGIACRLTNYFGPKEPEQIRQVQIPALIAEISL